MGTTPSEPVVFSLPEDEEPQGRGNAYGLDKENNGQGYAYGQYMEGHIQGNAYGLYKENNGQGNALESKLQSAIEALNKGNTNAAINKLQAFINQVDAYEKANILTSSEADALRQAIQEVINSI